MGTQQLVERILSDAKQEAENIVEAAEQKAAKILADASARVETLKAEAEKDAAEKRQSILEKNAASARLDSAKLLLKEKRKVLDTVYDEAHSRLLSLNKEDCLKLFAALLQNYAEEGDEIVFSKSFAYEDEVKLLPVFKERNLKIAQTREELEGGMRLIGEKSDKDLTFPALLATDREENQAQIAKEIFK